MLRYLSAACVCFALISLAIADDAAEVRVKVAPIYSLPPDGTWVEYEIAYVDRKGRSTGGLMRISSVGRPQESGRVCRWIEVSIEAESMVQRIGKFLIREDAYLSRGSLEDSVIEAYHQEGPKGTIVRLEGRKLTDYFTMGIRGDLKEVAASEKVNLPMGAFDARRLSTHGHGIQIPAGGRDSSAAPGEEEEEHPLEYRCWLTKEIPFGIARFEVWAKPRSTDPTQIVFSAAALRQGANAECRLPTP